MHTSSKPWQVNLARCPDGNTLTKTADCLLWECSLIDRSLTWHYRKNSATNSNIYTTIPILGMSSLWLQFLNGFPARTESSSLRELLSNKKQLMKTFLLPRSWRFHAHALRAFSQVDHEPYFLPIRGPLGLNFGHIYSLSHALMTTSWELWDTTSVSLVTNMWFAHAVGELTCADW